MSENGGLDDFLLQFFQQCFSGRVVMRDVCSRPLFMVEISTSISHLHHQLCRSALNTLRYEGPTKNMLEPKMLSLVYNY